VPFAVKKELNSDNLFENYGSGTGFGLAEIYMGHKTRKDHDLADFLLMIACSRHLGRDATLQTRLQTKKNLGDTVMVKYIIGMFIARVNMST